MKKSYRRAHGQGAHMAIRPRRSGGMRVALAAGALLGAGSLITWATFSDSALLNLGAGGEGIGSSSKFDIAIVDPAGIVQQADPAAGLAWEIADAANFVPGRTLETEISVFNNSQTYEGELSITVQPTGDGSVGDSPNITRFLRVSALDRDSGEVIFGNPSDPAGGLPLAEAEGLVGALAARGDASLEEGDEYTPGAAGAERIITLLMHYRDAPETADYNGGQAAIRVLFDAQSK